MSNAAARVVIAMSGGVDSSVAAALLVQQGYQVIGMMLSLWSEPGTEDCNRCCTPDAMAQARNVAAMLEMPFYAIDARQVFYESVVRSFISGYTQGITPNPCLVCNREIRWGFLLERARALGAQFLATGHYARLLQDQQGRRQLARAIDTDKDQSYVLHMLGQEQLSHTLFPLGGYTKPQVRQLARDFGLPVSERPDSQDLCFLGDSSYPDFLLRYAPQADTPGPIMTRDGRLFGQHKGLAFYTIGQRKGLGVSAPYPLYVLAKQPQHNALIVGRQEELGGDTLNAQSVNWIAGQAPAWPIRAQVKIRYTAQATWATVTPLEAGSAHVLFDQPQRDITPGQAAVFYQGEICLGGGEIQL
ncbi:MAG: tRNA 2-thiouridine(34) synthase MnmA [Anaerolineales bacterium]|nr:tRNA 2-thiouridine(34) synthase MnmA [Anaerolineales bacterium]